jgi:predicted secreted Zn-dependent protease
MKVDLNWGAKRLSAHYILKGADLEQALKVLMAREEWGKFEGNFTYKWKADEKGNVSSVTIEPTFTITMPSWPGYNKQPQQCKDTWDEMWHALRKHEDGHREIFEQGVAKLVKGLEEAGDTTGREVDDVMQKARSDIQDQHDEFDTQTENGKSQGVELVITQECRSKAK